MPQLPRRVEIFIPAHALTLHCTQPSTASFPVSCSSRILSPYVYFFGLTGAQLQRPSGAQKAWTIFKPRRFYFQFLMSRAQLGSDLGVLATHGPWSSPDTNRRLPNFIIVRCYALARAPHNSFTHVHMQTCSTYLCASCSGAPCGHWCAVPVPLHNLCEPG